MPNFEFPEFSDDSGRTWATVATVGTSDGTLALSERYADGGAFFLTYRVSFFAFAGGEEIPESVKVFNLLSTRDNRAAARDEFLTRTRDSIWS